MTRSLAVVLVFLVLGGAGAGAEPIGYVASLADGPGMFRLDLETGDTTLIPGLGGVLDLAFSPSGVLYGVLFVDSGESALVTIDPVAQTLLIVGSLPGDAYLSTGLTFDANGNLWLLRGDGHLFSVDPATAAAASIFDTGRDLDGLTACGDRLFTLDRRYQPPFRARLVEIDPVSETVIPRGPPHAHLFSESIGMDFDATGRLWAVFDSVDPFIPIPGNLIDSIVEIDPATGLPLSRLLFNGGGEGLAIAPPPAVCPEFGQPAAIPALSDGAMLLAIAIFLLLGWRALRQS